MGTSGRRIVLSFPKQKRKKEYPAGQVKKIVILRPSAITMHAVKLALDHEIDVVYLGNFGKPVGRIFGSDSKGLATLRRSQLEVAASPKAFSIAKSFVVGKVQNQIVYLEQLERKCKKSLSTEIAQAKAVLETAKRLLNGHAEQLLGMEGYAADRYFAALKKLFRFPGRRPQGRDKFNSALNYAYGILYNEVERACLYIGLDPYLGLYHTERYGKPSLVLDMVEEFRVPVADMAIIPLFIGKKLRNEHFIRSGRSRYQLSQKGKSVIVEAVFNQLQKAAFSEGKSVPLKSVIELQAQALARAFLNKHTIYKPFEAVTLGRKTDE